MRQRIGPVPLSRILVPTDGSEEATKAASYAAHLAGFLGASVVVLYVQVPSRIPTAHLMGLSDAEREALRGANEEPEELAARTLSSAAGIFAVDGIEAEAELLRGEPGETIVRVAQTRGCNLIIMGRRGLGLVKQLALGSVSEYVLRRAHCPVLIVRGRWPGADPE